MSWMKLIGRSLNQIRPLIHLSKSNGAAFPVFRMMSSNINDEKLKLKKARLIYQARKRGTLESGLLLSNFASVYLDKFSESELDEFDRIMCHPAGDWAIYYWAVGKDPFPEEFKDSKVLHTLKEYAANVNREKRYSQPDLH